MQGVRMTVCKIIDEPENDRWYFILISIMKASGFVSLYLAAVNSQHIRLYRIV